MMEKFFKKKEPSFVLGIGRKFGKWEDPEESYIVGSTMNPIQLSKKQMQILTMLDLTPTLKGWKNNINNMGVSLSQKEFTILVDNFRENKLLVEIKNESFKDMREYIIVRNGIALGIKQGKWCVGAHNNPNDRVFMSEEEYKVWISASGIYSIPEVIKNISEQFSCDKQKAFALFKRYAPIFVGKMLWTIECTKEVNLTNTHTDISILSLNEECILLPVGQEFNTNLEGYQVNFGRGVTNLTDQEYVIWTLLHQQTTTIENLAELIDFDIETLKNDILPTLFQKKVVCVWDRNGWRKQNIQFISKGAAMKSKGENEVIMKASPQAKFKKIPMIAYLAWSNIGPGYSQEMVVKALSEDLQISVKEAEDHFYVLLPFLIKNYLVDIVVKEG